MRNGSDLDSDPSQPRNPARLLTGMALVRACGFAFTGAFGLIELISFIEYAVGGTVDDGSLVLAAVVLLVSIPVSVNSARTVYNAPRYAVVDSHLARSDRSGPWVPVIALGDIRCITLAGLPWVEDDNRSVLIEHDEGTLQIGPLERGVPWAAELQVAASEAQGRPVPLIDGP